MTEAGFTLSGSTHPICPVMLYDAALASSFADELLQRGIYVIGFSFPVVPKGNRGKTKYFSAAFLSFGMPRTQIQLFQH